MNNDDERTTSRASLNDSFYCGSGCRIRSIPVKSRMAFVAMVHILPNAQRPQRPDTADAEQHLLLEPVFPVAAVQVERNQTVLPPWFRS